LPVKRKAMLTLHSRMARGAAPASQGCLGGARRISHGATSSRHGRCKRSLPMRTLWVLTLGLVTLTALQGCKRNDPKPIPGPKAGAVAMAYVHTPGIAYFQGSLDEAFAGTEDLRRNCREHGFVAPRAPDVARSHKRLNLPVPAVCSSGPCPPVPHPR